MKRISVIIPCYNADDSLDRCFQSLINQTIGKESLELIFVDDASTDHGVTWEKIVQFEKQYPDSVIAVHSQENNRVGGARNIGLSYATGKYIGFVDQDDRIGKDMYQRMYDAAEEYETDVVKCRFQKIKCAEDIREGYRFGKDYMILAETQEQKDHFLAVNHMGYVVWDKLYKKELIDKYRIRFPDKMYFEDTYFTSLYGLYVNQMYVINEVMYYYFQYETSTKYSMNLQEHQDLLKVNCMRWEQYEQRGAMNKFRDSCEYNFIRNYYLGGLHHFSMCYEHIAFDLFCEMKKEVKYRMPLERYKSNIYLEEGLTDFEKCILELAYVDVDDEQWKQIDDTLHRYMESRPQYF